MSKTIDKILSVLDQPLQSTTEDEYVRVSVADECWRCGVKLRAMTPLGACDACVADLKSDTPTTPARFVDQGDWCTELGRALNNYLEERGWIASGVIEPPPPPRTLPYVAVLLDEEGRVAHSAITVSPALPRTITVPHISERDYLGCHYTEENFVLISSTEFVAIYQRNGLRVPDLGLSLWGRGVMLSSLEIEERLHGPHAWRVVQAAWYALGAEALRTEHEVRENLGMTAQFQRAHADTWVCGDTENDRHPRL